MDKNRSVVIESDWIDFKQEDKFISGFGIVQGGERDYLSLMAGWLAGWLTKKQLLAEIKKICEG